MILRSLSYSGDSARVPLEPALLALPGFTLLARVGLKDTRDLFRELATLSPRGEKCVLMFSELATLFRELATLSQNSLHYVT